MKKQYKEATDLPVMRCNKWYGEEAMKVFAEVQKYFNEHDVKKKVFKLPNSSNEFKIALKDVIRSESNFYMERVWYSRKRIRIYTTFPHIEDFTIGL